VRDELPACTAECHLGGFLSRNPSGATSRRAKTSDHSYPFLKLSTACPTYKQRGVKQGGPLVSAPMSNIKVLLGQRLVVLRKRKNFSQEALANESGLARSYLSSVERGLTNISVMNIELIADVLGIDPYELLHFPKDWIRTKRKPKHK
jgi:DNA-binding Xre family transcriptional regulator